MNPAIIGAIGLAITALAISGAAANLALNVETSDTHVHTSFQNDKELVDWINENFISEGELTIDITKIKETHEGMMADHQTLLETVDDLKLEVAILKAQDDVVTQPGPTPPKDTVDLSLRASDNKGQIKSQFPRDVVAILINGESTYPKTDFLITIKGPSGDFVKDKFSRTLSDGDISEAWIPSDQALAGKYQVTVTIKGFSDSLEFSLL